MRQTICKEKVIEVSLGQIIPTEKDSRQTYYRLEQDYPGIWTVLSTKSIDFNKKSIRGMLCFKNVPRPVFDLQNVLFLCYRGYPL